MYKRIIAVSIVLLVAMSLLAKDQTSVRPVNDRQSTTTYNELPKSDGVIQNVPIVTEQEVVVTWRDNPNNCDQTTQYISAESPFKCIDKPVQKTEIIANRPVISTDCNQYRHVVEQYSGWNVDTMMYAMKKESSCNPNAVGDTRAIGGIYAPSCGLLQIRTLSGRPTCEQLKDPIINIQWAYKIWQGQGYNAWSVLK